MQRGFPIWWSCLLLLLLPLRLLLLLLLQLLLLLWLLLASAAQDFVAPAQKLFRRLQQQTLTAALNPKP